MNRFLIRLVFTACAFYFVFPLIPGIQFHGNFFLALGAGVLFAFLGLVVESIAIFTTAMLAIGTFGLALIVLIPAWVLGFWLLPALVLRYVADIMPTDLSFTGWGPAIWGGLIMLVIGIGTSRDVHKRDGSSSSRTTPAHAR